MDLIIVDDNKSFLEALSFFVETKLDCKVVESFSSPLDLINYKHIRSVDCILVDIEMPELNGIETARKILEHSKEAKFIAITNHVEKAYMHDLIGAGFKGCVFKNNLFEELKGAIEVVTQNGYFFPKGIKILRE